MGIGVGKVDIAAVRGGNLGGGKSGNCGENERECQSLVKFHLDCEKL